MNLSGRLVDAFLALEDTRRFALAAERCHVSPSAFSQMISRLEEQVGARLFDRDTRNVSLTPEGEVFAAGARRIAGEMRATLEALRGRAAVRSGRVAVAGPPSLAADWLPERMAAFRARHPDIVLRLHDVVSDRCLDLVARGEVDFGINAIPGNPLEFEACHLFDEPSYVICREDDPLAGRRSLGLRDLRQRPFIHTVRSGSVWQQLQAIVQAAQVTDTGLEVNQLGSLGGLVKAGFGISIVPQFALQLCKREGVAAVRLNVPQASRPIYAVRRRGRSLSVAAQAFWDMLTAREAAPRLGRHRK
ncbi:LysR family transcriptional regulator [Ramlibacter sp. MAHUQ-53]|uniref:LysR family transcriptional regulator n=1 Tax=unclassified Ramlibacter TaxID=2617605 RepID=UPI00362CA1E5